jgi:putative transposase
MAPAAVHTHLLDRGIYLCSVRTMYRILDAAKEVRERRNQLRHPEYSKPELLATGPNQVWSWDITKLLGPAKGTYFYLYVILDIFSRYAVGWMLAHREGSDLAKQLISETVAKEGIGSYQLTMHSDRGPTMRSLPLSQLLANLTINNSFSRPYTSSDNPFSEAQFRTVKYRPTFPARFSSYEHAHGFCRDLFPWYNFQHYHSGIGYLTPAMLHHGLAHEVLSQRQQVLDDAYRNHPERFVRQPPEVPQAPTAVWINPPTAPDDKASR